MVTGCTLFMGVECQPGREQYCSPRKKDKYSQWIRVIDYLVGDTYEVDSLALSGNKRGLWQLWRVNNEGWKRETVCHYLIQFWHFLALQVYSQFSQTLIFSGEM